MDPSPQDKDGSNASTDPAGRHLGQYESNPSNSALVRKKRAVKRRGKTSADESTPILLDAQQISAGTTRAAEWDAASSLLPPFPRLPQESQSAAIDVSETKEPEAVNERVILTNALGVDLEERLRRNLLERTRREEALNGGDAESGDGGVDVASVKFHRNVTIRLDKNTVREYVSPSTGELSASAPTEPRHGETGQEPENQSADASKSATALKRMSQFIQDEGSGGEPTVATDNASSDSAGNDEEELGLFEHTAPTLRTTSGSGVHINSFLFLDQEQPPLSHGREEAGVDAFQGTPIKRMSQFIRDGQAKIQFPEPEASTSGEGSRSVSFINPDSPEASSDVAHSSHADRLRRLSNTLAPRNMPYVDSGEDWDSEGDTRSSRSNRMPSSLRDQLPDSNSLWDSGGDDSDAPLGADTGGGSDQQAFIEHAQKLEALCMEQAQIVENLRDSWLQCTQLETNLSESFKRFEDLNRLAEEGSGTHSGEVELLFTVLHGVSSKKVEMDETLKLVQTAAKELSAQSWSGAQRLAAENSNLESFVASLQNQINEKDLELKQAIDAAKALTEDKEDLHEAVEELQQLLQCSDDELEALKKENQELHETVLSDRSKIADLELVQFSADELKALKEENQEMELQLALNEKEITELVRMTQEPAHGGVDSKSVASQCNQSEPEQEMEEGNSNEGGEEGALHLGNQLKDMQVHLEEIERERDQLRHTVKRLEQEAVTKGKNARDLELEAQGLRRTCNQLSKEVDELRERGLAREAVVQQGGDHDGDASVAADDLDNIPLSSSPSDADAGDVSYAPGEEFESGELKDEEGRGVTASPGHKVQCKLMKAEGVQVSIEDPEMSELHARAELVERENHQLSEALQEASQKYLQEIEQLQQGSKELLLWREQLQISETENGRLRRLLEEAGKRPGDESLREQLDSQARMNEELRRNHALLTQRLAELSDRLGSSNVRSGNTTEIVREVKMCNDGLVARVGDLERLLACQEGENARLEGELHQLLERISESQPPVERSSSCPIPSQGYNEDTLRALKRELEVAVGERDALIGKAAQDQKELTSLKLLESNHAAARPSLQARIADLETQIQQASQSTPSNPTRQRAVNRRESFMKKFIGVLQKSSSLGGSMLNRVDSERKEENTDGGGDASAAREPAPESHASLGILDVPPESSSLDPKEMIQVLRSKLVESITYSTSQRDVLNSLRERLAKVEESYETKLNDAERSLTSERESKERAELLLGEGAQLMKCLVTTIRACMKTNMEGLGGEGTAPMLERIVDMLSGLDGGACARNRAPCSPGRILGSLESGAEPVPLE